PVPAEKRDAVLTSIVALAKGRRVDTADGVTILEADRAVLVRPSGTEPIFRVSAEGRTSARADALAAEGVDLVKKALRRSRACGHKDQVRQNRAGRRRHQVHRLLVSEAAALECRPEPAVAWATAESARRQ